MKIVFNFFLLSAFLLLHKSSIGQSSIPNCEENISNFNNWNLNGNKVYCITQNGTYNFGLSGNVTIVVKSGVTATIQNINFNGNNRFFVESGANVSVGSFNTNGFLGEFNNQGVVNFSSVQIKGVVYNSGTISASTFTIAKASPTSSGMTNSGTLNVTNDLNLNSYFINNSNLSVNGNLNINNENGASFINNGNVTVNRDLNNNREVVHNAGVMTINGNLNINSNSINAQFLSDLTVKLDANFNRPTTINGLSYFQRDFNQNSGGVISQSTNNIFISRNLNSNAIWNMGSNVGLRVDGHFQSNSNSNFTLGSGSVVNVNTSNVNGTINGSGITPYALFYTDNATQINGGANYNNFLDWCYGTRNGNPTEDQPVTRCLQEAYFNSSNNPLNPAPLPVTWVHFEASIANNDAKLFWKTSEEVNNLGFEVEFSVDGLEFKKAGFVNSKGNNINKGINNYHFSTEMPNSPKVYYRIKQIDFDGKFSYSRTIVLKQKTKIEFNVFPNPTTDLLQIALTDESIEKTFLYLYNIEGKLVYSQMLTQNTTTLSLTNFPKGIYVLQINSSESTQTAKIVLH